MSQAIVLCGTDAGGLRNLVPLLAELERRHVAATLLIDPRKAHLLPPEAERSATVLDAGSVALDVLLEQVGPMATVSGTTRFFAPDRQLVELARVRGIHSVVIVDEWYGFRHRFETAGGEGLVMPDAIAVPDEQARAAAIQEGLPGDICHATGSPALAELACRAEAWQREPPPAPSIVAGCPSRPVITFLSETHAADYGRAVGEVGPLGPYLGYTEETVLTSVHAALVRLDRPLVLVEKLHPSTAEGEAVRQGGPIIHIRSRTVELWPLLCHSQFVIGMRSMALLEARMLGRPAVSFQPGLVAEQTCTAVRLGLIPVISSEDELTDWCRQLLENQAEGQLPGPSRPTFAGLDAAANVLRLAGVGEPVT